MIRAAVLAMSVVMASAGAPDNGARADVAPSTYAGMEARWIKSLSPEDLQELWRGGGWGLALPAELNGVLDASTSWSCVPT